MPSASRFFFFFTLTCLLAGCAINYGKAMLKTENSFYAGQYDDSVRQIRELTKNSNPADRLLFLMEAGTIFHYQGDYEYSNKAFMEAEEKIEALKEDGKLVSFLINEASAEYRGEDFEVVMVRLYIALNFLYMNQYESAKIYLRKVNFDLKQMKYKTSLYKQNLLARYLDAIISEYLKEYNDARVQYKNIATFDPKFEIESNRYALAVKERDTGDMKKYSSHRIAAYDQNLNPVPYHDKMGELVVMYHSGKSPVKESRGKLLDDPYFAGALKISLIGAIRMHNAQGLTVAMIMGMLSGAENPVPVYKLRPGKTAPLSVYLNGKKAGTTYKINDYELTALKNYNESYHEIVNLNVASLASKIVTALVGSYLLGAGIEQASGKRGVGDLVMVLGGASAGAAIAATTVPDLRCWRLIPANYQVKRFYLEPGIYRFEAGTNARLSPHPVEVNIEPGKPVFLSVRGWTAD